MAARLTRKEMKRDRAMESFWLAAEWARTHSRLLIIGLVALMLAIATWGIAVQMRSARVERANELLAEALSTMRAFVAPDGADPDAFATEEERDREAREQLAEVVERYPRTGAAAAARLLLASAALEASDTEGALELWREVERRGEGLLAAEAELNLIEQMRVAGEGEAVVERLRESMERGRGALPADAVMAELAATLDLLGREDEAATVRRRLREQHPRSPWLDPESDGLSTVPPFSME